MILTPSTHSGTFQIPFLKLISLKRLFDMTGKGYINARELSDGLLRLSISVDTSDVALFI
jgi:hypothetical protein